MGGEIRAFGVAWYRQEDYAKIKKIMVDHRKLPDTYKKWLKSAEQTVNQIGGHGHIVEKVYIDPDTFPAWCRARGLDIDADARMRFANEAVIVKYRNQS